MVREIGQDECDILPGYVGNLTAEQEQKLREMWDRFFEICDKATGQGKAGAGAKAGTWGAEENDPKNAGIPKGDEAKEEAKKREEEAAMNELLTTYGSDALRDSAWRFIKFDNPDTGMLRFLRARKWDVSRAIAMLASCLKWRLDNDVEKLAEGGDLGNSSIEKFLDQQRSGKTYALGTSTNGLPICYIHVGKHRTFGQPGTSMQKYVIYAMESFRLLMQPPNDKVVLLFDLTGFSLKCMDWNCILFIVKCLEAYYPESLGTLFIMNAPWIFWGIWKVLSPLLDPVVRSKVVFVSKPEDMTQFVPRERLIKQFKGTLATEFDFVEPQEGENDRLKSPKRAELEKVYFDLTKEHETQTREWIKTEGKDAAVIEKRELLTRKLRVAQFDLEPYVRGLCVTHRDGTIDGQGRVTWIYRQTNGEDIRHVVGRQYCAATLKREIKEMEAGAKAADVAAKSEKACKECDYVTLYGDERLARKIEGSRVDGKIPEIGATGKAALAAGAAPAATYGNILLAPDVGDEAVAAAPAPAAPAAAPAAAPVAPAAPAAAPADDFKDAPEAPAEHTEKAVDGDKALAQNNTHALAVEKGEAPLPAEAPAAAQAPAVAETTTKASTTASSSSATATANETSTDSKDSKGKLGTLGRRFGKMMSKAVA